MNLASSKLDFGCKHLLGFAKPRLSVLRGLNWGLFYRVLRIDDIFDILDM